MNQTPAQLPLPWVEKIFRKLTLVYGRDFMSRWEGQDESDVVVDWAEELAGFINHPDAISYALKNLPAGKPPTVIEFREIARKAPPPVVAALTYTPTIDPVAAREMAAQAKAATSAPLQHDPKQWARNILARQAAGEKLPPISVEFAKRALGRA